jgi:hypothetical protein
LCEYGKKPLEKKTKNGGEKTKMNAKYKKSLKIVTLLISSIIIATVAADSYTELFMTGSTITIGTASVIFTNGLNTTDLTSGAGIPSPYTAVTFDNITGIQPGETRTYEQAVNITNNAATSKGITIDLDSIFGNFATNFDYINVTMIDVDGNTQGNSIEIVSTGSNVTSTGPPAVTMSSGDVWAVRWIIKAQTDASNGESFTITLKVTVS